MPLYPFGPPEVADNTITNAKLADMATARLKGRVAAGAGDPEDLTAAQATALLDAVVGSGASAKKGLVPAPPTTAGTSRFLREDATWAEPPASASSGMGAIYAGSAEFAGGMRSEQNFDNFAPFNAAVAAAQGRDIILPPGPCEFSAFPDLTQPNVRLRGQGGTILRRMGGSTSSFVLRVRDTGTLDARDIEFDCNKLNTTAAGNAVQVRDASRAYFERCGFTNAKNAGGLGSGVQVNGVQADDASYVFRDCWGKGNDGTAVEVLEGANVQVLGGTFNGNGNGVIFGNLDQTLVQKIRDGLIKGVTADDNILAGIAAGNYLETNVQGGRHGPLNPEVMNIKIVECFAKGNGTYGIAGSGDWLLIAFCDARENSDTVSYAGIYCTSRHSLVMACTSNFNVSRAYEFGGMTDSEVIACSGRGNGNGAMNIGGSRRLIVRGGTLADHDGIAINVSRYDASSPHGGGFDWSTEDVTIEGVRFFLEADQYGISTLR